MYPLPHRSLLPLHGNASSGAAKSGPFGHTQDLLISRYFGFGGVVFDLETTTATVAGSLLRAYKRRGESRLSASQ